MKRLLLLLLCISIIPCWGCTPAPQADIAATTLPVYEFTSLLCQGTDITVTRLVTESVSCLHDYTLQVGQMRAIEGARAVVVSGAGLEEFLEDALGAAQAVIDASEGIEPIAPELEHGHSHDDGHHHDRDPHLWLSPENAKAMAANIAAGLTALYPEQEAAFDRNLASLLAQLDALHSYGQETLSGLKCRELVTFHDGFAYFAQAFDLHILEAVEEESGSEASAAELIHLIGIVEEHGLPAIFVEANGSASAAQIIAQETGTKIFTLDMAMAGDSYFDAMYRNINTVKEALG